MKKVTEYFYKVGANARTNQLPAKVNEIIDWINNQEKVIPTQTPNSDSNQRLIKNIENVLVNAKRNIKQGWYDNANNRITVALQYLNTLANGETPVEDNTVETRSNKTLNIGETLEADNTEGQVSILFTQEEINKLKQILDAKYSKDWEFKMTMILKLSTNKPVETK